MEVAKPVAAYKSLLMVHFAAGNARYYYQKDCRFVRWHVR